MSVSVIPPESQWLGPKRGSESQSCQLMLIGSQQKFEVGIQLLVFAVTALAENTLCTPTYMDW